MGLHLHGLAIRSPTPYVNGCINRDSIVLVGDRLHGTGLNLYGLIDSIDGCHSWDFECSVNDFGIGAAVARTEINFRDTRSGLLSKLVQSRDNQSPRTVAFAGRPIVVIRCIRFIATVITELQLETGPGRGQAQLMVDGLDQFSTE